MSEIQVGQINSTDGSTAITTGADGYVSFAKTQIGGSRNRIINGNMMIDQRNAGAAVNTNDAFPVDRWKMAMAGGGVISAQRSTVAPEGFANSIGFTVSTADASIAAGDSYFVTHNIEGYNVADLGFGTASAQPIAISFRVRSSVTGTYSVAVGNSAFNRLYVATYTISVADTWETKTITISGDTTGTWLADSGIGLRLYFDLGSGSNYNASSADAWLGSGVGIRTSGSVNWISNAGAIFYITGVQLEVGTVATPFEHRSYGEELALCQRYFQHISRSEYSGSDAGIMMTADWNGSSAYGVLLFPSGKMRTQPTVTLSSAGAFTQLQSGESATTSVINTNAIGLDRMELRVDSSASDTTGQAGWLRLNANAYVRMDAEL